jgi:hypothetical protein
MIVKVLQPLPNNLSQTTQLIRAKYTPLANAIRNHWPGTEVEILPIVMSLKGTPHSSTITSLTSLLTLRTDPLDKLISKARLDTPRILAQLHTHTLSNGYTISSLYTASNPARPLAAPPQTAPSHAPNCMPPPPRIAHSPGGSKTPDHLLEMLDLGG